MMTVTFKLVTILCTALLSGLVASCVVSVYLKYKSEYQTFRKAWMPVEPCEFCMGFWISVPVWLGLMVWTESPFDWPYFMIPLMSAAVAKWTNR